MLTKVLPKNYYEVEPLPDDSSLLETILRTSPDLVFLQLKEPNNCTFSIIREIKLLSPQTMVIVVGEVRTPDITIQAFRSQAFDVINWPTTEQELKERMRDAFVRKGIEASKNSKEQLSLSIVHQLRNPLGAISGHVQQLLRTLDRVSKSQIEEELRQVLFCCIRMEQSLNESINAQRGITQTRTTLDANTILENALALLTHRTGQKNITVAKSLCADLPCVKGNSKDLQEAFVNFITNSVEAMQEGGVLTIETGYKEGPYNLPGRWICVAIKDTGCGIKEEDMPWIFTPFFTTKGEKNIGLGLSIAKEVIESHHGHVEVNSKVAKGAKFYIYLPAAEE
ncbi:MAG TPA: ATP-binding protein [Candidatus Hypogeohydataceae bacterium YC41]